MAWWNRTSKPDDEIQDPTDPGMKTYTVPADALVGLNIGPGTIIPCDVPKKVIKTQTGYEWFEWSHGGKGVPWRINTKEFNRMLMSGWEIVDICNSFTLLKKPTFVHYLESPKRRKK